MVSSSFVPDGTTEFGSVVDNSRQVEQGSLFFAISGAKTDGNCFIRDAVGRGAVAVVVDETKLEQHAKLWEAVPIPVFVAKNSRRLLAEVVHDFYGSPSKSLFCIGVTGTNGKTSTVWILSQLRRQLGLASLSVGTLGVGCIPGVSDGSIELQDTGNTTPGPLQIIPFLNRGISKGVNTLVCEVTSQGIAQERIRGIEWDVGLFTNLSRDHLDLHGSMEAYASLKKKFFTDYLREQDGLVL